MKCCYLADQIETSNLAIATIISLPYTQQEVSLPLPLHAHRSVASRDSISLSEWPANLQRVVLQQHIEIRQLQWLIMKPWHCLPFTVYLPTIFCMQLTKEPENSGREEQ